MPWEEREEGGSGAAAAVLRTVIGAVRPLGLCVERGDVVALVTPSLLAEDAGLADVLRAAAALARGRAPRSFMVDGRNFSGGMKLERLATGASNKLER